MPLVQVRRAIYAYVPADGDELAMSEGNVLYILNDDDADWLQAKRKVLNIDDPEEKGLVPANHTEIIPPIAQAKALYDYAPMLNEETALEEDEAVDIVEDDDPDWYMAKTKAGYGFVPKAYVEIVSEQKSQAIVDNESKYDEPKFDELSFDNQKPAPPSLSLQLPTTPNVPAPEPPALPSVPAPPSPAPVATLPPPPPPPLPATESPASTISHYNVVLGKKKKGQKITLGISNPTLVVDNNDDAVPPKRYATSDITRCSTKKSVLTVEIGGFEPAAFDFTCTANAEAERIADAINAARRGMFLGDRTLAIPEREDELPPLSPPKEDVPFRVPNNPVINVAPTQEMAVVLYDFASDDSEELTVNEGDRVLVLDNTDPEWWQVQLEPPHGRAGLVPAAYVEIQPDDAAASVPIKAVNPLPPLPTRTDTVRQAAALSHNSSLMLQPVERNISSMIGDGKTPDSDNVPLQLLQKRPEETALPALPALRAEPISSAFASVPATIASVPAAVAVPEGPNPNKVRTWTDGSGAYTVEAEFIRLDAEGNVHLHKTNNKMITVSMAKFSDADRNYVSSVTGQAPKLPEKTKTARQRQQENAAKTPGRRVINYDWDWFDFFTLKCGITADNALKYATSFVAERLDDTSIPEIDADYVRSLGVKPVDVPRLERAFREHQGLPPAAQNELMYVSPRGLTMEPAREPAKDPVREPVKEVVKDPVVSPRHVANNPWGVDTELDRRIDRRRQIEDDEEMARKLQQQEEDERRRQRSRKQPLNLGVGSRKNNKSQTSVVDPAQLRSAQHRLGSPLGRAASPPATSPLAISAMRSSSQSAIDQAFGTNTSPHPASRPQMEQVQPRARPTVQQPQMSSELSTQHMAAAAASGNTAQMNQLEQMAKAKAQELAAHEMRIKQQQEEIRQQTMFLQQQQQQLLQMQQTQKVEAQLKHLKEEKERLEKQRQADEMQKQVAMLKAQQEQMLKMQQMASQARIQQQQNAVSMAPAVSMTANMAVPQQQQQQMTNMNLGMATPMTAVPQQQQLPLSSRLPPPLVPSRVTQMTNSTSPVGMFNPASSSTTRLAPSTANSIFTNHAIAGSTPNLGSFTNQKYMPNTSVAAAYSNNPAAAQSMSNFGLLNQQAIMSQPNIVNQPNVMSQSANRYDMFKSVNPHAPSIFNGGIQPQPQQSSLQFSMNAVQPGVSRPNGPTGVFAMANPTLTQQPQMNYQQQQPQQQMFNTRPAQQGFGNQLQWH
ncbi:cytoskeletal protein binding protein [Coemansia sp. RSA 2131]|nr:cytoskeletal protein binding protein [Coemansia sp. RSA 2131]